MNALRLLGAACIALSGLGIGIAGAFELRRRVRTLTDFIATFVTIRAEIVVCATPIGEIAEGLMHSAPRTVRTFYARVYESMCFLGECSFADIWRNSVEACEELGLKPEELGEIISLGASLGRYDAREQEDAINLCISRLNTLLELAREESKTGGRLVLGLGAAGGLVLVIILI